MEILLHPRERQLLAFLNSREGWITAGQISEAVLISNRTVRNYVVHINEELKPLDIEIKSLHGCGYQLNCPEEKKALLGELMFSADNLQTREDRVAYLLPQIIESENGLDFYNLENEMFISHSTLDGDIGRMIDDYENNAPFLSFIKKGSVITAEDNEWKKRVALCKLFSRQSNNNFYFDMPDNIYIKGRLSEEILRSIKNSLNKFSYILNLQTCFETLLYIAVSEKRIDSGNDIGEFIFDDSRIEPVIKDIINDFFENEQPQIGKKFSETEKRHVVFFLGVRRSRLWLERDTDKFREMIGADVFPVVEEALSDISRVFEVDFSNEESIRSHIYSQLFITFARIRFLWERDDTMLIEINNRHPETMDMACIIANKVTRATGLKLHENEISYIATKISEELYVAESKPPKVSAVIISIGGISTNMYIQAQINSVFGSVIELKGIYSPFELDWCIKELKPQIVIARFKIEKERLNGALLQLVRMPLGTEFFTGLAEKIALLIQHMLPNKSSEVLFPLFKKELYFYNVISKTPEEGIHFLCEQLKLQGYVDSNFEETVLVRNRMSKTLFNSGIMVPHQLYPVALGNAIAIAVLQKPVFIKRRSVHCIIIPAFRKEDRQYLKNLWDLIIPLNKIMTGAQQYEGLKTIEDFMNLLKK